MQNSDDEFNEFLKENFKFPSNNMNEIICFINKDLELKKLINDLPKIIMVELEYNQLLLDFMKETDPNEKILEISIYPT